MTTSYDAAWIPGLNSDFDRDDGLKVGFRWLLDAEQQHGGRGVIVMYAKRMVQNAPLLGQAAQRWAFVSPRSSSHSGLPRERGPVLAIWPGDDRTLEMAEELARASSLCVIPGSVHDVAGWIRRSGARCLVEGYDVPPAAALPDEVRQSLDHILSFGGHNSFLGGGEKEDAIRELRAIARRQGRPTRQAIEEYVRASGDTDGEGARRLGSWYEEILLGKRHRDYRGRVI